jgi:ketosteroid isomerase-like protein
MKTMIALALLLAASAAQAEDTSAVLHAHAQALADATGSGQAKVWAALLDDHMIMTDENGAVTDKAASVKEIVPLPAGASGHINVIDWHANVDGDVAASSQLDDEYENYHGQKLHAQYRITCSWVKRTAGWKLLSMQVLATRQDPPAMTLPERLTDEYVGRYSGGPGLDYTIEKRGGRLLALRPGRPASELKAELADVLFVPGQPRSRDIFQRNPQGRIIGFVSRREERDVVFRRLG